MKGGIRLLSQELAVLGLDLQSTLQEEPRFLMDATFLGSLHLELGERMGAEDARAALLQLGYLHGLRDALLVVNNGLGSPLEGPSLEPAAARLAMRLQHTPVSGGLEITGNWPDHRETNAVIETIGAGAETVCHLSCGYTSGWLSGVFDADILTIEVACRACGDEACGFLAREATAWVAEGDGRALATLEALPMAPLRDIVERHLSAHMPPPSMQSESFERDSAVIHVWGPVMVIPFSGSEEAHRALDLIVSDPGARDVRVVVVDLAGAIIDEGFGAAALEQVLDSVEATGAEPILTGISPLSEAAGQPDRRDHRVAHRGTSRSG